MSHLVEVAYYSPFGVCKNLNHKGTPRKPFVYFLRDPLFPLWLKKKILVKNGRALCPNQISDSTSQPHQRETEDHICTDIRQRIEHLAIADQVYRIIAKRRKGCKATKNAHKDKGSGFRCKYTPRFSKLGKKTDHKTTDEVDR